MIKIHDKSEFEKMRKAGKLAAKLLDEIEAAIKPGITTQELDDFAKDFAKKHNATSACYGYKGHGKPPFPGYICTSVNHTICHGIPNQQVLEEGDIIKIDTTLIVDGYHGDTCRTYPVGTISKEAANLIAATKEAMEIGIAAAQPDNYIGDIGYAIGQLMKNKYNNKYSIVEDYCGHGIGQVFHQAPQVEHINEAGTCELIVPGMFFTIEPMINLGKKESRTLNDKWTVITKDYSLSAQFEHTIGITENGPEIFTIS